MKKILISGILGVDSAVLSRLLLNTTDYEIYGLMRRSSNPNFSNIAEIKDNPRLHIICGDICDRGSLMDLVGTIHPNIFVNFAGYTQVGPSWETPSTCMEINFGGVLNALEAIRKLHSDCRFFQAGSSEIFGDCETAPQNEQTKHNPRNFYGISKSAAAHAVRLYREKYGIFCISNFLYNHECELRNPTTFVFPKICKSAAKIAYCIKHNIKFHALEIGDLNSARDFSDTEDIIDGIWKSINHDTPQDFVLASGVLHSIKDIINVAFDCAGVKIYPVKSGSILYETEDEKPVIKQNPTFFRTEHSVPLVGDSTLARNVLNWKPQTNFNELVRKIVALEMERLENY